MKRGACILILALVGCAGAAVDGSGASAPAGDLALGDHRPPKMPPVGTGGGPTASGCNGVTAMGRCEISDKGQIAVACDVPGGKLNHFDCSAMLKVCVLDSTRGAMCATLPPPADSAAADGGVKPPPPAIDMAPSPPPPALDMAHGPPPPPPPPRDMATMPMCASGVTYRGYCASASGGAADTAIWCDPSTGQTLVVDCKARGKSCVIDGCADGAYCCDAAAGRPDMAQPASTTQECTTLGYAGQCAGGHARWCSASQLFDIDCAARGQTCKVDGCASGAYCCDAPATPPDSPDLGGTSECDRLGLAGECLGNSARWCSGGQLIEIDCATRAQTCQVNTCATGAYCCS